MLYTQWKKEEKKTILFCSFHRERSSRIGKRQRSVRVNEFDFFSAFLLFGVERVLMRWKDFWFLRFIAHCRFTRFLLSSSILGNLYSVSRNAYTSCSFSIQFFFLLVCRGSCFDFTAIDLCYFCRAQRANRCNFIPVDNENEYKFMRSTVNRMLFFFFLFLQEDLDLSGNRRIKREKFFG